MCGEVTISAAVEGDVDEAVIRKIVAHIGAVCGDFHGKKGKNFIRTRIHGYNAAARHAPWVVLVDLDGDAPCAPPLRANWLPVPSAQLCFRIAVREVEAWLLADCETLARFLGVARGKVPANPESILDPKGLLVNLARGSRHRSIREDIVPRPTSGRTVGPAYSSRMIEFVTGHWDPARAANRSESLQRAIECMQRLAGTLVAV